MRRATALSPARPGDSHIISDRGSILLLGLSSNASVS